MFLLVILSTTMRNTKYFLALIPGILAIAGNIVGGNYLWMNIAYNMLGMVLLDRILPEDKTPSKSKDNELVPNLILVLSLLVHTLAVLTLLMGAYSHSISSYYLLLAVVSTGLNSGISGIISAHEMIHRKQAWWQALGKWNLLIVNYSHFFIEHIKVHHKWVGTNKDAATARYGESIYAFFLRTVPAQYLSAFQSEAKRLEQLGIKAFGWNNFVVRSTSIQLLLAGFILATLGVNVLLVYWGQSLVAIFLLEYVNYIEHYGLVRKEGEKYSAEHAWQSDTVISRFSLIELSRHSDHHLKASKQYQTLDSHISSPVLPSGYFGVFYQVLIPALWFKKVHPLLDKMYALK